MSKLMTVTFLPTKRAPPNFRSVFYIVECFGKDVNKEAHVKALGVFAAEHNSKYYRNKEVVITETRTI